MKSILLIVAIILSGCASQNGIQNVTEEHRYPGISKARVHVTEGRELIFDNNIEEASEQLDTAILLCKDQYASGVKKVFAARGVAEGKLYLLNASDQGEEAIVVDITCSEALYLKGYTNIEMGQFDMAEKLIWRAVAMAPVNSVYLSELAHIYQVRQDWVQALDLFEQSEQAAIEYSPDSVRKFELARAKRGISYSLIELGRLDAAEVKLKECLEIDSNDEKAINELKYIEELRKLYIDHSTSLA